MNNGWNNRHFAKVRLTCKHCGTEYLKNPSVCRASNNFCSMACRKEGEKTLLARLVTFNGKTQNLTQWAAELGIDPGTIRYRLSNGWPLELALSPKRYVKYTKPSDSNSGD